MLLTNNSCNGFENCSLIDFFCGNKIVLLYTKYVHAQDFDINITGEDNGFLISVTRET